MNNLTKEINKYTFSLLKKGDSLEKIAEDIIKNSEEFLDNTFDLSDLKEYIQYIITLSKAKTPTSDSEKYLAFTNTLEVWSINDSLLYNEFSKLSKFDKIIYDNNKPLLAKLNTLFSFILEHTKMILLYKEIKNKSTIDELTLIGAKSGKNIEFINPKLRILEKAYNLTKENSLQDSITIYKKFKENPIETDMVLGLMSRFSDKQIKKQDVININAMRRARTFLECNDIGLDEEKIMESLAIYFFAIYKKNSYLNGLLQINKELSRLKVSDITNIILSNIFEDTSFNFRHTHIAKPIQHYSYFADFQIPLYEFRNSRNYKEHPFLEKDVDDELLSFFKSK